MIKPYICERYFIDKDGNRTEIESDIAAERIEYTDGTFEILPIVKNVENEKL